MKAKGKGKPYKRGRIWWIRYSVNGREERESSGSINRADAVELLKKRRREILIREIDKEREQDLTLSMLLDNSYTDALDNGYKTLRHLRSHRKHLFDFFGDCPAASISARAIKKYRHHRMNAGVKNATINREVMSLSRAFTVAAEEDLISVRPVFPKRLTEPPPRQGFFKHEEYLELRKHLPAWAQDVLDFSYRTGWRRTEIWELSWKEIDVEDCAIRLHPDRSKNSEARWIKFPAAVLQRRLRERVVHLDLVFHRDGKKIHTQAWSKVWHRARNLAGQPGRHLHDCRRTAVRNFIRANVKEQTAMKITGHKSHSVFRRYNITDQHEVIDAADRMDEFIEALDEHSRTLPLFSKKSLTSG